ncbi:Protein SSUH2 like protein [Argiope bruennichi]|uniref:Protein SSUH2 like protein n=1 Tax=Argiope bruennichi TaxID=94029 RepID=A0A8T0E2Y1_ARGBR|nr:Protein SSUH2 like protein [Argiope bruennichi]
MRLRRIAALIEATQLQPYLRQAGPITLFAPTDEAFALSNIPNDPRHLREFVLQHVVQGRVMPTDVRNDVTLPSLRPSATPLRFNVYEGGQMLSVSGSQFLDDARDIENIRIQPIDRVLYPISNEDLMSEVRLTFPRMHEMYENILTPKVIEYSSYWYHFISDAHRMPGAGLQPEICPTAPDIGQIEKIPGYEGITFEEVVLPPPTFPSWEPDQRDHKPLQNLPVLSEEEVRDAVTQYASENCCYGSKPAREMKVKEIEMMSAFHYKLETFAEKRESAWKFEPYTGQSIDGPANGPAPSPWDVTVPPSDYFKDGKKKVEVPHTAFVKPCHACVGIGRVRCSKCDGYGRKQCTWCEGRGRRKRFDQEEQCDSCGGSGFDRCIRCSGSGQVKCPTCNGKGNLKAFVELTVSWANHVDDYISETSSMPKELVKQVTGQVAYEEENPRVFPIMHAPDVAVRNASNELVTKHGSAFTNERILKQRQCLRIIPIGHVKYEYNDKVDEFFVYGYEHKVYFKSYPQKCCCCTIM